MNNRTFLTVAILAATVLPSAFAQPAAMLAQQGAAKRMGLVTIRPNLYFRPLRGVAVRAAATQAKAQQVYINGMEFAVGNDLTANTGDAGITIPVAVTLSTDQQIFDLRSLPITYAVNSPSIAKGDYGSDISDLEHGKIRVFSKTAGAVVLTLEAPTTFLGTPGTMYTQVVVNFFDPAPADGQVPLLVVASTQKATAGQTANLSVVVPPGTYPAGDYHLYVLDQSGQTTTNIPLGQVVQPGQAIPISGHQVLPFDRGGWLYNQFQLVDYSRPGVSIGYGSGYANIKYAGIRNLDARTDDAGNITMDITTGNLGDYYRAFLVTTDGFAVELPTAPPFAKQDQGVRLVYYKGSMLNAPLFTPGEYTPVVVEYIGGMGGSVLVHSLPNAIHLDGDNIPMPAAQQAGSATTSSAVQ